LIFYILSFHHYEQIIYSLI